MSNKSNSKLKSLQQALNITAAKPAPAFDLPPTVLSSGERNPNPGRARSRAGQVNISAWMDPAFKSGLRLVQARKGPRCELQDLIAEALNDLFAKYEVPAVPYE